MLAILDPFSGVAGDMFLGALVDLGLEQECLAGLPAQLGLENVGVRIARTNGAHPLACATINFGSGASALIHRAARNYANAFHMPMIPSPPPVGYTITEGSVQSSCSASSNPSVLLPSVR